MRTLALILVFALSLVSSSAFAASYQQIDGTIVDPILSRGGEVQPYTGSDLEPLANLNGVYLNGANLSSANLGAADLSSADPEPPARRWID